MDTRHSNTREDPESTARGRDRGRSLDLEKVDLDQISSRSSDEEDNHLAEGTYYEWRKIVSDCSVSCGKGLWLKTSGLSLESYWMHLFDFRDSRSDCGMRVGRCDSF